MTSSNDAKATMKAVRIHAFGGPEELRYEDAPRPEPKPGEVLIRIYASAVNPADWKLRSGLFGKDIPLPLTLGFDFSGVIDTLGEGVTRWKVGDEVYGYALGAYAEYIAVKESIAQPPSQTEAEKYGVRATMALNEMKAESLNAITQLVDSGKLQAVVDTVLPLSEARRAQELIQTGHTRGKIALKVI